MISRLALYRKVAKKEGGKKQVDIAQVSEVGCKLLELLSKEKPSDVLKLLGH